MVPQFSLTSSHEVQGSLPSRRGGGTRAPRRSSPIGRSSRPTRRGPDDDADRGRPLSRASSDSNSGGQPHSRSRGRTSRREPVRAYSPFRVSPDAMKNPLQRDLSPTTGALFRKANKRFRVRLATENAFPTSVQVVSFTKAEVSATFGEVPRRLLRFREDKTYEFFITKLVSSPLCKPLPPF